MQWNSKLLSGSDNILKNLVSSIKKLLAWSKYRKWATLHPLVWQNLQIFMRQVVRVTGIVLLLLLIGFYKKKKIKPMMSKGLNEKWMQTERINIFSCLTYKISLQYFCVSDKGNECVSQIWIEKWPLPVYICTKEGGFWFFIHWIFS